VIRRGPVAASRSSAVPALPHFVTAATRWPRRRNRAFCPAPWLAHIAANPTSASAPPRVAVARDEP